MDFKDFCKKVAFNFKCDYELFSCAKMNFFSKIAYLARRYSGTFLNKRGISFMGNNFFYDTRFGSAIFEAYPAEIETLNKVLNLSELTSVLDTGANIGQFSFVLAKFFPRIKIFSFEPNSDIFQVLIKNSRISSSWKTFNYGIAQKEGLRDFFYSEEASPEGSFFEENLNQSYQRKNNKHIKVKTINLNSSNLKKLGIPNNFDLIKIDVEGSEIEVLKSLKGVSFNYLWIEASISRKRGGSVEELRKVINTYLKKKSEIIYLEPKKKGSVSLNVLFKIN